MSEQQIESQARFGELRSLLAGDMNTWGAQNALLALVEAQAAGDIERFHEAWVPYLQDALSVGQPWSMDNMDRMELLSQLLPFVPFELSLAGRLALYVDVFSRRTDVLVRFDTQEGVWSSSADSEALPADILAFRRAFSHVNLRWKFGKHLDFSPDLEQRLFSYHAFHGHVSFDALDDMAWVQERYPNRWKVVDRNAREFIRLNQDVETNDEEIYLIASFEMSREDAYIGVTHFIDGGLYGDEPACETYARFDDLETFLTRGARHGFVLSWPYLDIYPGENHEDIEMLCKGELTARSCPRSLPQAQIMERLRAVGISELAAQTLWDWLQEDVALLIELDA